MKNLLTFFLFLLASSSLFSDSNNSANSANNQYIINHDLASNSLIILNAKNNNPLKTIPIIDKKGNTSGIAGVHDASVRNSFIVALKDSPEIWEINYQNPPPAGFGTWVHDYRKDSGEAVLRLFPIRRLTLNSALDDFFFEKNMVNIISVSCTGEIQIIDLDLGRRVAKLSINSIKSEVLDTHDILGFDQEFLRNILDKSIKLQPKCTHQ